ncbi:MAG: poly-beta-1,6 N-acetyl-D-glucosamine synthase [Neisseria sp.]|nr:poly-beta-1,6 N-acetyl-D-glucosamine synthase [Neisseria sp.]
MNLSWYEYLGVFVMLYPGVMAAYWTISGILYFVFFENRAEAPDFDYADGAQMPMVSVLIPCFNEEDNLEDSIPHLLKLNYPNYELVFINDGSRDATLEIIEKWAAREQKIVALTQSNSGKAAAMNNGLKHARGQYIVGIDGDAVLDYHALDYIVQTLEANPMLGAVTGNPRVRNRSTVLGKLQVAEFSSIIGLIKRSQSIMGTLFTVSGVIVGLRKEVIEKVGGWSTNMITDDIDVSWKIQTAGHNIAYEPRALCWVLMPETLRGLYKQRLRWAQGGAEVVLKYFRQVWRLRNFRLWPLYIEYLVTLVWAYSMFAFMGIGLYQGIRHGTFNPHWFEVSSIVTLVMFAIQFSVSIAIDNRYEKGLWRYFISCIWYPYAFWMINSLTLVHGLPKAILRNKNKLAVWVSPDRGVQ